MKSLVLGLLLAATGFLAPSFGAFAQTIERPDIRTGDRWSWQHINGLANEKDFTIIEDVIEITESEIRTRIRTKGKSGSAISVYSREWNPIDVVSARYDPNLRRLAFPLQVGKTWEGTADKMLFSSGRHGKFRLKAKVGALEKITVPAGTFDAYKIELILDASGTDEDANVGHTVETNWYAPAVKQYVRTENVFSRDGRVRSKDIFELLEFSLR